MICNGDKIELGQRKINKPSAPIATQYAANGVSVFVLKYCARNFAEKYAAMAAAAAPTAAVASAWALPEARSGGSSRSAAAPMIGVASRNENRKASSCDRST